MDQDEVGLMGFWSSPCVICMRVKIAQEEKGVSYKYLEEDQLLTKNFSPLLLKTDPVHKKVPIFLHNAKPVCESLNILQYIDDVWNDKATPKLLPEDPFYRAKARFWVDFFDKKIVDCGRKMCASKGAEQEAAAMEFIDCLKLLEVELGEKPFFGGEQFGLLDIALIPVSCRFYTYETCCNFSGEKECPKIMEWVKKCSRRPMFPRLFQTHIKPMSLSWRSRKCMVSVSQELRIERLPSNT